MENLRKQKKNLRKQMKSVTEEEKNGLQELWRGLKVSTALSTEQSRIRKEEKKSKEKEPGTLLQRPI